MVKPNFLVVGAQKAGTTSLYTYLDVHPEVYMSPIKELRYFSREFSKTNAAALGAKDIDSFEQYCAYFSKAGHAKAIGEVSPSYMYYPGTAERILQVLPEIRIIAVLRNPVDRAFSEYWHHWKMGRRLSASFRSFCLEENIQRTPDVSEYQDCIRRGLYYKQLIPFFTLFPKHQLKVIESNDLLHSPSQTMREVYKFLNIDCGFEQEFFQLENKGAFPKKGFQLFLAELRCKALDLMPLEEERKTWKRSKIRSRLPLETTVGVSNKERKVLEALFEEDAKRLTKLLHRDFSHWFSVSE